MTPLLAQLFQKAGIILQPNYGMPFVPQMSNKAGRDKAAAGLAVGYPGAKLVRAAQMGRLGVSHLGLRLDAARS